MSLPAPALDAPLVDVRMDASVPVVVVAPEVPFDGLREEVRARMPQLLPLIGGRAARLDLGSRTIELFDLRRLIHLLREEFGVGITGLYARPEAITRFAERELKLKLFPLGAEAEAEQIPEDLVAEAPAVEAPEEEVIAEEAPPEEALLEVEDATRADAAPAPAIEPDAPHEPGTPPGRRTLTVERTLRSGASVRFDGDILVLGDVNPGAQVVATGNVLVLGALKGLAHAGASGDTEAFILSFDLRPTQVRIARKIAIPPDRTPELRVETEVARIIDDHVVIEPYKPRNR